MAIDTSIYAHLLQPKSVADYDNEAAQSQQNRLALLLKKNELADYQRNRAGEDALGAAIASGRNPDQIAADLAGAGHVKQALAYTKQQQELANAKATGDHLIAQTGKLKGETDKLAYDQRESRRMKAISDIAAFTSPEQALTSIGLHEQAGDLSPEAAAAVRATLQSEPNFSKWKMGMLKGIMSANDVVKADETARHNGATEKNAAGQLAVSQGQLGVAQGQLKVAQQRESREATAPKGVVVQSDTGPLVVDPRDGTGTPVTVGGKAVPSKGAGQVVKDAQSVLNLLDMAEPLLDTATHSMVGAGLDRAAAAFGKSTEGAQASAQLKALEGALIAKQPKMSGPQSDKDVLLYRQMAGQIGDASVPVETRRAALKTVRALNEKYAGQAGPADQKAGARTITRTGMHNGRKVIQYSDGSIEYAN